MYIRDELNPRPRFTSPRPRHQYTYSPSPSSQYSNTSFDPLSTKYHSNNNTPSYSPKADTNFNTRPRATSFSNKERMDGSTRQTPTHSGSNFTNSAEPSTHKDLILAQLVEMGFALDACKSALATCSTNASLQDVLDILVQSTATSDQQVPLDPGAVSSEEEDIGISSEEAWKQEQERRRKEYLNELKRNSQTVDTSYAEKQRKEGNYYFNKGLFIEAESSYSLAIASLPAHHSAIVLLSNNRAATRLKLGKYQACLDDCSIAIQLASKNVATNAVLIDGVSSWKSQWLKALHRKACALEGLGLYDAAIHVYEEYARTSGVPRTAIVNQGIQRCQDAMQAKKDGKTQNDGTHSPIWKPSKETSTAFPDIDFTMFMPKQPQPQANMDEINASKAVREMREREKKREAEEAERLAKEDKVNAQLIAWKNGKEQNLRSLLASLELILCTSRQFDQLSNSVIKSMPRIKYEIKSIAEEARAIQRKIEAAKQKFEQLEKQTEPTLGQLRKPHIVKTRMEECQNLLDELKLEKSKPMNPVSEMERKTETTIQQDTQSLDPAAILDLENPLQIYQNTQDNNNNNNAQANNVFKKMGVPKK
ncbi:hypothetical protein RMATCC62417_17925 [Rhizopus microsporus]|nr:hypothetical protein RMATCC62417_17925 [Rhizopus microsporus]